MSRTDVYRPHTDKDPVTENACPAALEFGTDIWTYDTETCGRYRITTEARDDLASKEWSWETRRYKLAGALREAADRGQVTTLTTKNVADIADSANVPGTPIQAVARLVRFVADFSKSHPEQFTRLSPADFTITCSKSIGEFMHQIDLAVELGLFERHPSRGASGARTHGEFQRTVRLTAKGWQEIERVGSGDTPTAQQAQSTSLGRSHVFISYVREDSTRVDRLKADLEARAQSTVWIDREQILPGQNWAREIRLAISEGMLFLACFSDAYFSRDTTHMNEELTLAVDEMRKQPDDRVWFVPVLLDDCRIPDIEVGRGRTLRNFQAVPLFGENEWDAQINRIARTITQLKFGTQYIP